MTPTLTKSLTDKFLSIIVSTTGPIIVTCHKHPDDDAIGAMLAVKTLLSHFNKETLLYSPDFNKKRFHYLRDIESIHHQVPKSSIALAVFVDCSSKERICAPQQFPETPTTINIDHHQDNVLYGDCNIVRNVSSTCEIIYELFNQLDVPLNHSAAHNLYAGISFDTGHFKFSNTTSRTHHIISQLLQFNVNVAELSRIMFDSKSMAYFNEVASGLQHLYKSKQFPYVIVMIPFKESTTNESSINFFRQLEGKELTILCKEIRPNCFKISFRSVFYINAAAIAYHFNGGGHVRAAGAEVSSDFDTLQRQLIKVINDAFRSTSKT